MSNAENLRCSFESSIRHGFAVLAFYVALFIVFFSPALFSGRLLAPGDAWAQSVPAFYFPPTLWSDLLMSGFPMAADPQVQSLMTRVSRSLPETMKFGSD